MYIVFLSIRKIEHRVLSPFPFIKVGTTLDWTLHTSEQSPTPRYILEADNLTMLSTKEKPSSCGRVCNQEGQYATSSMPSIAACEPRQPDLTHRQSQPRSRQDIYRKARRRYPRRRHLPIRGRKAWSPWLRRRFVQRLIELRVKMEDGEWNHHYLGFFTKRISFSLLEKQSKSRKK